MHRLGVVLAHLAHALVIKAPYQSHPLRRLEMQQRGGGAGSTTQGEAGVGDLVVGRRHVLGCDARQKLPHTARE